MDPQQTPTQPIPPEPTQPEYAPEPPVQYVAQQPPVNPAAQYQPQPAQPTTQPLTSAVPVAVDPDLARKNKRKLIWGLVCLIAPTALFLITVIGGAVASFVIGSQGSSSSASGDLFQNSPAQTVTNVIMYAGGAITILTWLPGIIVGIVLLVKRKRL